MSCSSCCGPEYPVQKTPEALFWHHVDRSTCTLLLVSLVVLLLFSHISQTCHPYSPMEIVGVVVLTLIAAAFLVKMCMHIYAAVQAYKERHLPQQQANVQ